MMCAFAIAGARLRSRAGRWGHSPPAGATRPQDRGTAAGVVAGGDRNSGAMTLYLWHIPPLLAMHLVFDYLGYPRFDLSPPGFIALSVVQLLIMGVLVALVFVTLRRLENNPLPLWDGGLVARPGGRSLAVGALLCVAGAATLASVGWGLKDQGLFCVAVMLIALVTARGVASDAQRVCAASLPARMT